MNLPKITVITPSYNQAQFLEETMQSIITQDYPNLEWMIFDGGSNDGSIEIIKKYEEYLHFWESVSDKGQSDAINKGFEKATGDIITWLNSDDLFTPNALHKVASYFADNQELSLLFGKTILFGDETKEHIHHPPTDDFEARALAGLPFAQPSSFFSKSYLKKVGKLDESLHYGMDYAFFLPAFLGEKYMRVEDVFSKYRYHTESKSVSQNSGFARDYGCIFSKLLQEVSDSQTIVQKMKRSGFYTENPNVFLPPFPKKISKDALELALSYNLLHQLTFYYEALDLKSSHQIVCFLKQEYPSFFKKNPELKAIHWRSKWLTKPIIQLLRTLKKTMA